MKKFFSILLVATFLLFPAACNQSKNQSTSSTQSRMQGTDADTGSTVKFGVLAPLTGSNAEYGRGFEIATKMAADEINSAGGINGKKIELVVSDSKGEAKESTALATQFAEDKSIKAIIGDFTSGASMANAPIVDEYGIVQLSPTASNPDYANMSKFTFSIMGRQDGEGPFFAKYILAKKLGVKKVAAIYINSDWGISSFKALTGTFSEVGLDLVAEANYVDGETDFSSVVSRTKAANPDAVVILDQGNVPNILTEIKKQGWTDVKITSLGPGASEQLIELSGTAAEGVYISTPFFFNPENKADMAWAETFEKAAGFKPTVHPVVAYDSVYLLAEACKKIQGELTRGAIRDALQSIEYEGMSGPIKFNEAGDITRRYVIAEVIKGHWVMVEDYDYSKE